MMADRSRISRALASVVLLMAVIAQSAFAAEEQATAWEFITVSVTWDPTAEASGAYHLDSDTSVRSTGIQGLLDPYGAEGWELVSMWVESTITRSGIDPFPEPLTFAVEWTAAFKRPVPSGS